jgi:protein-tyrosine-phosphatase
VVEEIGLDLSKEFPKPLTTDIVEAADVVITMGWADACPVFPGKRYLDWELPDPAGKSIEFLTAIDAGPRSGGRGNARPTRAAVTGSG